jgi:hypothetical protein
VLNVVGCRGLDLERRSQSSGVVADRQAVDTKCGLVEYDDGAGVEVARHDIELVEDQLRLSLHASSGRPAHQEQRRPPRAAQRKKRAEVGVGADKHTVVRRGRRHDGAVISARQPDVADVIDVVAGTSKKIGKARG